MIDLLGHRNDSQAEQVNCCKVRMNDRTTERAGRKEGTGAFITMCGLWAITEWRAVLGGNFAAQGHRQVRKYTLVWIFHKINLYLVRDPRGYELAP